MGEPFRRAICYPPSAIRHLSSVICHLSSVICHLPSAICHLPSVICHPASVICHFPIPHSPFRIPHFLAEVTTHFLAPRKRGRPLSPPCRSLGNAPCGRRDGLQHARSFETSASQMVRPGRCPPLGSRWWAEKVKEGPSSPAGEAAAIRPRPGGTREKAARAPIASLRCHQADGEKIMRKPVVILCDRCQRLGRIRFGKRFSRGIHQMAGRTAWEGNGRRQPGPGLVKSWSCTSCAFMPIS